MWMAVSRWNSSWAYDFGFGLSTTDGFYLTTNTGVNANVPEFHFDVKAFLDGSPNDPGVTTAFSGTGKLLFFKVTLEDQDIYPDQPGFQPSGVYGGLTVNYSGNSRGRLTYNHIVSTPLAKLFDVNFGVDARLNMGATLEVDGVSVLPKLKGDLKMDWGWDLKHGASCAQHVRLERFRVDVGTFVTDFLKPIAEKISGVLEPFRPSRRRVARSDPWL